MRTLPVIFIFLFSACNHHSLSPADYLQWMDNEKNGCHIVQPIGEIEYDFRYKTPDYIVATEQLAGTLNGKTSEERRNELAHMEYYALRIKARDSLKDIFSVNGGTPDVYYSRSNYFSFEFQHDLKLIIGSDTIDSERIRIIKNFNVKNHVEFVLLFENGSQLDGDRKLLINDKMLSKEKLLMQTSFITIKNLPALKM